MLRYFIFILTLLFFSNKVFAVSISLLEQTKSEIRTGCISKMAELDFEHKKVITPAMVTRYSKICSCVMEHPKTQPSLIGLATAIEEHSKNPSSDEAKKKGEQEEVMFEKATDAVIDGCSAPKI